MTNSIQVTSSPAIFSGATGGNAELKFSALSEENSLSAPQSDEQSGAVQKLSSEQFGQVIENLKKNLSGMARNLQFSVDETSGRTIVKVVDANTQELIRQIPSEDLLAISESLTSPKGFLIKQEV